MNKSLLALLFIFAIVFSACRKTHLEAESEIRLDGKFSPDGFDYATSKKISINVQLLTRDGKPVSGVLTSIYLSSNTEGGSEITKVISDRNGLVKTEVVVPAFVEDLIIDPAYVGLARNIKAKINNNSLDLTLGGKSGYIGDVIKPSSISSAKSSSASLLSGSNYIYNPAHFDALGRPLNLEPVDSQIDFVELMKEVNASLPERKDGIYSNPHYISSSSPSNLNLSKSSDVWITFVHEGANFRNALGYYTYPTGQKPASAAEIGDITLVFPNASLLGHTGVGNMMLGDKVKIGNFPSGTSIGFVLLQNAYTDGGNIITTNTKFYTDEEFNTVEPDINMRRHSVLLYSRSQEVYLIGFEDTRRDISTSDNDFNDLVFYVQTDPKSGIDPTGIPELDDRTTDTDGDGTPDAVDEFPTDPTRAYTRFYPTKNNWGTLAFEDQWPLEGDYDFNDLVLSYRYKFVMNSQNMVVDVIGEYSPLAAGAVFNNGFGIELPVSTDKVKSVTGYSHQLNYIRLNSNGTEAGQSSAVIIPFDNVRNLFSNKNYSGETYINTFLSRPKYTADTVRVTTTFNTPQYDASVIGKAPFNPFMISNVSNTYGNPDGRGKEIHLVNQKPTALANTNLLGTGADDSNSAQGRYYITADNRPFALNIVADFQYPIEKANVGSAYQHFNAWALSGGALYKDWYLSKPGYRNNVEIYNK